MCSPRALLLALTALAAAALAGAPSAFAAGGLSLAPSYVEAQVHPGTKLGPLLVTNSTGRSLALSIAFFRATEDLSGLPVYETSAPRRAAGARLVRVAPGQMTLSPGQSRALTLTAVRRPPGAVATYGVVVVLARALGGPAPNRGAVAIPRVRISANVVLRFPGAKRRRAEIEAVSARSAADGLAPEIVTRLAATGNTDLSRGGHVRVADSRGRTRARLELPVVRVLPGARRDTAAALPKGLPPGRYTARASVPGAGSKTTVFRLIAGGRLARAALRLTRLVAHRDGHSRVHTSVTVRNTGTEAGSGSVQLVLVGRDGGRLSARELKLGVIAPRESKSVDLALPRQTGGAQVLATLKDHGFRLDRSEVAVTATRGARASIEDWLAAHVPLLLAGFLAILLAAVAGLAAWARSIRRAGR